MTWRRFDRAGSTASPGAGIRSADASPNQLGIGTRPSTVGLPPSLPGHRSQRVSDAVTKADRRERTTSGGFGRLHSRRTRSPKRSESCGASISPRRRAVGGPERESDGAR